MNPNVSRRQILEQVRRGELSVADATARLGGASPGPVPENGETVWFQPVWERTGGPIPRMAGAALPALVVLDTTADAALSVPLPIDAITVRAVAGSAWTQDSERQYRIGVDEDAGWARLWEELAARDLMPQRVVIVTAAAPERCLDAVYPLVRTLILRRQDDRPALACLAVGPHRGQSADALGGFCAVAAREDRRLHLVGLTVGAAEADPVGLALTELAQTPPASAQVRYDGASRWTRTLAEVGLPFTTGTGELPHQGVYVLTGGAGGIGLRIGELLAERTGARLVLMGRSEPDAARRAAFARIENLGGRVHYVRGDVTRAEDVAAAVLLARAEYGPVTGALHLAGVNEDAYVVNKPAGAHRRVLDPKLVGARNLDEATRNEPLRLFALFSSMSAYLGHPGQGDYAAAGRALGGFAAHRAARVRSGERSGATVSVGWPLWAGGGMTLSENDRLATEKLQGMTAMPAETGLAALVAALRSGLPELLVVHGRPAAIRSFATQRIGQDAAPRPGTPGDPVPHGPDATQDPAATATAPAITEAAQAFLLDLVGKLTRMPAGVLRADQEFSTLGIDSVMVKRLSVALEDRFGPMPVTLFFEHRTVAELARHLADHHPEALRDLAAPTPERKAAQPLGVQSPAPQAPPSSDATPSVPADDPIAIVGIAGRYPGAADLDELWRALSEGRDCTGEIPADRWDKDRWFDAGDRRPGSSYGRWGGFLSGVSRFDSLYFGIAPREAERMDPAERLFLEVAWSAVEDAGYSRSRLHQLTRTEDGRHSVGVFVGTTGMAYELVAAEEWGKGNPVSAYSMEFSLANRLSYVLDVHGPSLVVDTACSASLTALHLACESLRHGECRMAVAGGAYLNLHPMKYAMLSEQRMISPDGVCRAFGEGSNGFVPGEGVGAVVLKPLSVALADGDQVHAVIRSTAISHGGKTNGYTVPSPKGHAAVIRTALRRAGVDPRTIGYVEAHGTGTELGDPIEIEGLSRAFGERTTDRQFCALGSVKTNIGHAEAAAGIAGLTKVVLQLRHRTLAPTLHSEPANPRIDFAGSPFRLQRTAEPWHPARQGVPLRAALSSFGAGGANAHAVVEEFTPRPQTLRTDSGGEHLILLSARTPEQLAAMAGRLAAHRGAALEDMAYTLQVGRDHLEHRLATVVRSLDDLRERLTRFAAHGNAPGVLTGRSEPGTPRPEHPAAPAAPTGSGSLREQAERWVTGAEIDWGAAHPEDRRPLIVSLPGYPFAGPSHWPATTAAPAPLPDGGEWPQAALGPRTETGDGTAFPVRLSAAHAVVADHLVGGHPVLAGVAQLELVRAAAHTLTGRQVTRLTDVRWRSPLDMADAEATVLLAGAGDTVTARLVTDGPAGRTIRATLTAHLDDQPAASAPTDLSAIVGRCALEESGEAFYANASERGLSYGPSYRLVRRLWRGEDEALAELAEQPEGAGTGWWLEPGVTDAALHVLHGAAPTWESPATLPAGVDAVRLLAPTGRARWAHARLTSADAERGTVRCDVTLCDVDGRPLAEFTGFTAVRPGRASQVPYFRPVWRLSPLAAEQERADAAGRVLILTTGHDHGLGDALAARHAERAHRVDLTAVDAASAFGDLLSTEPAPGRIYFLGGVEQRRYTPTDLDHLEASQRQGALALFHLAQALAARRPRGTRLTVLTSDAQQVDEGMPVANPFAASLHGLTRTLARELSFLRTTCIDLDRDDLARCAQLGCWDALLDRIDAEPAGTPMSETALRDGVRLVKRLEPAELGEPAADRLPLRAGGRYLLVGGAGGLGQVIGEHLARTYGARLMLVGRRAAGELPYDLLDGLRRAGAEVEYHRADITEPGEIGAAVARMRERFGGVDGVIHTAFRLADRTLARMDEDTFRAALDPKVRGTVALCGALGTEQLDFLALFSSAIAHTGNPGQANYAAGSTFLAAYGRSMAGRLHWPVTVFDWGFWGEQGVVATEEHRRRLADWGIAPLSATEGVRAFRASLAGRALQIAPLKADGSLAEVTPVATGIVHRAEPATRPSVLDPVRAAVRAEQAERAEPYASDYLDSVDAYGRRLVRSVLSSAGLLAGTGLPASTATNSRQRLYEALLAAVNGEIPQGAANGNELQRLRGELVRRFPHSVTVLVLLDDCAAALPAVLTGTRRGLEVLFPGGSDHRVAALYHDDPRTSHFNALCTTAVRTAVKALLDARGADALRPVSILEIGAGTGGTTRPVLDSLDGFGTAVRYHCTDLSPTLVGAARQGFASGRPHVECRVLDIAGDLAAQGFGKTERYDLVLATNVLHATPDIRRTLANVAELMNPGALLVLNEATRVLDSITPVFGLTDGWWLAEDPQLRLPHAPLIGPGGWQALLVEAGMSAVTRHGVPGWTDEQAGQQVFLAERGTWRTTVQAAPTVPAASAPATLPPTALAGTPSQTGARAAVLESATGDQPLFTRTVEHLTALYADLLRLPPAELDPATPLSAYGTDSLTTMEAAERLERDLGPVPQEALFTGDSVEGIARQLIDRSGAALADLLLPGREQAAQPQDPVTRPQAVPEVEPIAIVGMAGRYPAAEDLDAFWARLLAGASAVTEVPADRWPLADHHDPSGSAPGRSYHRWGAFLDGVDRFDPLLFRISPREAERMDPAQRLFLETAWETLEDAGWPPSRLRAAHGGHGPRVGVFVGVMHGQYQLLAAEQWGRGHRVQANSSAWSIANRVSHCFGLTGPSMAVDTACSSALTALHLAVQSLRSGECSAALAGGVNVILHPSHHLDLSTAKMLSRDGRARAFDTAADGMVTGEGVGAVLLKRLSDALRDGDRIHACVLGSAVNADGPTEGFAVPSVDAQVALVQEALRSAGADADSIQYVEAQATGSPVGDTVELAALRRAYDLGGARRELVIGSLKPGTGHLEAASGVAQLTKVLLQMRHGTLAPTIGEDGPATADGFRIVREPAAWRSGPGNARRRAAVSSFGAGGANAHVVLEEAPAATRSTEAGTGPQLLVLSARRPDRLREHARRTAAFLRTHEAELALADVAHTLRTGREPLATRLAAVVDSLADAADVLDAYAHGRPDARLATRTAPGTPRTDLPARPAPQGPGSRAELAALGRAWAEGEPVDWAPLHADGARRIVALPHYPFARDRYWLPVEPPAATPDAPPGASPDHQEETSVTQPDPAAQATAAGRTTSRPSQPAPERQARTERVVTAAICELLHLAPSDIDLDDHLSDFGFDSVTMVQLADRLSADLATPVSPTTLYGCADVAALIAELDREEAGATTARSETAPPVSGEPTSPEPSTESAPASPPLPVPAAMRSAAPGRPAARTDEAEPIAVVGMAGMFPGSPDLGSFWSHLAQGHDLITRAPSERFPGSDGTAPYWGGFLDGVDLFDAGFFQITPREARVMDPQHRLFLQTVWSAVEEAGYDPADLAGSSCGLYVGVASSEYGELARERGADIDGQLMTGNDHSVLANRISFLLDLHGPSEPVDTACSSSLVAIHRAVRAIQTGECDLAIAGGVNVILGATGFEAFTRSGMLAADGRCKSFDHRADGYVRGEGVGAVLLKPLGRAQADGDHIHALITGTATNHGGRSASLTAPNPAAQAAVIAKAQERAGVRPQDISYVEAHGTGTALGDPIEFTGLCTAFGSPESGPVQYCGLGAVKTNIGHLETAAGIAGVIKVILGLRHRMLPPTLHVERVNPLIEPTGSPFYLVGQARPWDRPAADGAAEGPQPRRAGVSSFGFGGMNAHVIVEEPPVPAPPARMAEGPQLFVLSARDQDRLHASAQRLLDHLRCLEREGGLPTTSPADTAYTLQVGRRALPARVAVVAEGLGDLAQALAAYLNGETDPRVRTARIGGAPEAVAHGDKEIAHAVDRARGGDPVRLAALWADGAFVDWAALHEGNRRHRTSLPGYPFAPESHWLPEPTRPAAATWTVEATAQAAPVTAAAPALPRPRPSAAAPVPGLLAEVVAVPSSATATVAVPLPAPEPVRPSHAGSMATSVTAPMHSGGSADELRRQVRDAVADGIGIRPEQVDPAREFAAYGVDSIGAMRIMQRIQARYGDHIPMAAILEHPSVDRLTAHLDENYVLPDTVPDGAPDSTTPPVPPRTAFAPAPRLLPFTPEDETTGAPAYCLFGDTGELTWLTHLCDHLAEGGPVLGLEAPGFADGIEPTSAGVTELAQACASVIAERHEGGPCRVVGHGLAGLVAAETVRTLAERGVEVAELLLLGTPEPGGDRPAETPAAGVDAVAAQFAAAWGADRPVPSHTEQDTDARVSAAARLLQAHAPMREPVLRRWLLTAARWRTALARAAAEYLPRPVTGAGETRVIRAVRGADAPLGDFGRWIAPPPVIHELDSEEWLLTSADTVQLIAGARSTSQAADEPAEPSSPMVFINRHGNGRRSVWAHNLYGEVSYAIYLSRHLGMGKPVIGLEQLGGASCETEPRAYTSVEDMASHYVAELRSRFPGEPYLLGGCSFGGVLAYEMARQLQDAGEEVAHLIAIDPIMPGTDAWDGVDWGTVTAVEAEAFSLVMLGNAMCQRWGVTEQINLSALTGLGLDEQLGLVARHIHDLAPARPDEETIKRQILVRHELMLRNGDLLQEYRPKPLLAPVPTTLFHATQGFLAEGNDNDLPAVPRTSKDKSNGFAGFVGDRIVIHEMRADHHTIAHNENLARIAGMLSPLLEGGGFPVSLFPASLYPSSPNGTRQQGR
ncbi:SDR family NAD(P)-dependent oxidoreductase [Streptomyces goshikiensis]|uniref:SDR family NAD(P)-dependent oxidoreductase n=1 Tax=Streptomyces goshikiensis TaxID=1942 RepID=UPI002E15F098|nr:SDR family NAD(P)-dependent oxidoreductase [Streptomyces goshikiensis]